MQGLRDMPGMLVNQISPVTALSQWFPTYNTERMQDDAQTRAVSLLSSITLLLQAAKTLLQSCFEILNSPSNLL